MNEDNDNGFFTYGWAYLFFLLAGLAIYIVTVMPLRIIFKNNDKSIIDAMMPYSNILDFRSILSLGLYSVTAVMWGVIFLQPKVDDFLICFIFFAITATFLSIVSAVFDVREARE